MSHWATSSQGPPALESHQFAQRANRATEDVTATTLHTALSHQEQQGELGQVCFFMDLYLCFQYNPPPLTGKQTDRAGEGKETQCNSFRKNKLGKCASGGRLWSSWRTTQAAEAAERRWRAAKPTRPGHPIMPCLFIQTVWIIICMMDC